MKTQFLAIHHFLGALAGLRLLTNLLNPLFRLDIEDKDDAPFYGYFYSRIIVNFILFKKIKTNLWNYY